MSKPQPLPSEVAEGRQDHLSLYDGREPIGSIVGIGRFWRSFDALGNPLAGSPFKTRKAAIAAVNAARSAPCAADARLDNDA